MTYDPAGWYWIDASGKLFSSASQSIVVAEDDVYAAWLAAGNVATPWPRDDSGAQTDAALQWVFDHAGVAVFVTLPRYAAAVRYAKETGGITLGGLKVATDRASQAMISGAWAASQQNPQFATQWKNADGSWSSLGAAQIAAIASAVANHVAVCFGTESSLDAQISAGTITTAAQIDSAFAAITA